MASQSAPVQAEIRIVCYHLNNCIQHYTHQLVVQQNLSGKSGSIIPVMLYRFIAMFALYRLIAMFRMTVHESKYLIFICYIKCSKELYLTV